MEVKDTNPKDAVGIRKTPFSVIPWPVIAELGLAMLEGARKYGRHNYRRAGVRASVYFDANIRHMAAWFEGQDTDADSGLSHVTKAIASLVVLRDSMIRGNWVDDRPPRVMSGWLDQFNTKASDIIEQYPDAVDACTENDSVTAQPALGTMENALGVKAYYNGVPWADLTGAEKRAALNPPGAPTPPFVVFDEHGSVDPEVTEDLVNRDRARYGLPPLPEPAAEDNEDVIGSDPEDNEDIIISPMRKRFKPMAGRTIG